MHAFPTMLFWDACINVNKISTLTIASCITDAFWYKLYTTTSKNSWYVFISKCLRLDPYQLTSKTQEYKWLAAGVGLRLLYAIASRMYKHAINGVCTHSFYMLADYYFYLIIIYSYTTYIWLNDQIHKCNPLSRIFISILYLSFTKMSDWQCA